MIGRLLGAVPITRWLLVGAMGFAGWQWWQAQRYEAVADQAAVELRQSEARADALSGALEWQRDEIQRLGDVLAQRDEKLATITADISASRDALTTLERDDAETHDWSTQPVPVAIGDWVRQLAAAAGTNRVNADGAGASDRTAPGASRDSEGTD